MSWYNDGEPESYPPAPDDDIMKYLDLGDELLPVIHDQELSEDSPSVKSEPGSGEDEGFTLSNLPTHISDSGWQQFSQQTVLMPAVALADSNVLSNSYKQAEEYIQSVSFGRTVPASDDTTTPSPTILKPGESPKYKLVLGELPERSRVETQIKCTVFITPPPPEHLLRLPTDLIARPRFQLEKPSSLEPSMLYLDIDVVVAGDQHTSLNMCSKCIAREKKRAFRKKTLDPNEEYHWNINKARRLAILNCRELSLISQPKQVDSVNGESYWARKIELPLRLACYCRHHNAQNGYNLLLTLRDHENNIVGQTLSQPLSITDNHKEPRHKKTSATSNGMTSSWSDASSAIASPFDSSSDHSVTHVRRQSSSFHPYQRQSDAWEPRSNSVSDTPVLHDYLTNSINTGATVSSGQSPQILLGPHARSQSNNLPIPSPQPSVSTTSLGPACIQRAIPAQGSIRGGVEVTLLGRGFRPGLVVLFGENPAISTQCWSDSTLICHLPPATSAGPVPLTFKELPPHPQSAIFTYINDSEVKLVELALQVVGFKMSGKLEDAADVASKIVNSEYPEGVEASQFPVEFRQHSTEQVVMSCLQFLQLPLASDRLANINLRNAEGQTLLHLACVLGYNQVQVSLLSLGANVDMQDVSGMTPLHFAAMMGNRAMARLLLQAHADPFHRHNGGKTALEIADSTVVDLFPTDQRSYYQELNNSSSSTNLVKLQNGEDTCLYLSNLSRTPRAPSPTPISHSAGTTDEDTDDDTDIVAAAKKAHNLGRTLASNESSINHELMAFIARMIGRASEFTLSTPSKKSAHLDGSSSNTSDVNAQRPTDGPPKYGDLYPNQAPAFSPQDLESVPEKNRDCNSTISQEAQHSESWTTGPLKQLKNDHMLFTFWIPLLVIAFTYVVALFMDVTGEVVSSRMSVVGEHLGSMFARYAHIGEQAIRRQM